MKTKGYWRQVPSGKRVTREQVKAAVIAGGYKAEHADALLDASIRSEAFVMTKSTPHLFFEFVEPNAVTF